VVLVCFQQHRLGDIDGLNQQAMLVTYNTRECVKVAGLQPDSWAAVV
jgi:hypothetical protein